MYITRLIRAYFDEHKQVLRFHADTVLYDISYGPILQNNAVAINLGPLVTKVYYSNEAKQINHHIGPKVSERLSSNPVQMCRAYYRPARAKSKVNENPLHLILSSTHLDCK